MYIIVCMYGTFKQCKVLPIVKVLPFVGSVT